MHLFSVFLQKLLANSSRMDSITHSSRDTAVFQMHSIVKCNYTGHQKVSYKLKQTAVYGVFFFCSRSFRSANPSIPNCHNTSKGSISIS